MPLSYISVHFTLFQQPFLTEKPVERSKKPSVPSSPRVDARRQRPEGSIFDDQVAMGMTTEEVVRQAFKNADVDESGTLDPWAVLVVVVVVVVLVVVVVVVVVKNNH